MQKRIESRNEDSLMAERAVCWLSHREELDTLAAAVAFWNRYRRSAESSSPPKKDLLVGIAANPTAVVSGNTGTPKCATECSIGEELARKEKRRAQDRARYVRDRESILVRVKAYNKAHANAISDYMRAYRMAHAERLSANNREWWRRLNPERKRLYGLTARIKKRTSENAFLHLLSDASKISSAIEKLNSGGQPNPEPASRGLVEAAS